MTDEQTGNVALQRSVGVATDAGALDDDFDYDECWTCQRCDGEGFIIICPDDMCHGQDECIHGDGETTCPDCKGSGEISAPATPLSPQATKGDSDKSFGG